MARGKRYTITLRVIWLCGTAQCDVGKRGQFFRLPKNYTRLPTLIYSKISTILQQVTTIQQFVLKCIIFLNISITFFQKKILYCISLLVASGGQTREGEGDISSLHVRFKF